MSNIPSDCRYTKTHEWLKRANNESIMGITDYAQELLGDLVFVELPAVGLRVSQGDEIGVVESVKAAADFYSPISGVITAVNTKTCEDPSIINKDPYGEGWLVKIKPDSIVEIDALMNADDYKNEV